MSVIDILTRVDAICNKYDKYDVEKQKDLNVSGDDAFARLYASVEADIETALQKAELASKESKKASAVALNAEIRRIKARLLEEVPKLQRLAVKKVKGLSTEELAARNDLVLALPDRIQAIPDGTAPAPKQSGGWGTSAPRPEIKFDSGDFIMHCVHISFLFPLKDEYIIMGNSLLFCFANASKVRDFD
ncbi:Syntaxin-71 [Turnera subulata]|uniref:Syntaxin-71 n=1 Tax=Turnera subulata TaxID=218843 RepID=A0A9Q0GIW3_9ROSI|nr:Syntaxin-71 [Turnera subulata]